MGRWGIVLVIDFIYLFWYFVKVELTLVRFDHENKKVRLLLKAHELLPILYELNEKIEEK
jgi:hypothetical protein